MMISWSGIINMAALWGDWKCHDRF